MQRLRSPFAIAADGGVGAAPLMTNPAIAQRFVAEDVHEEVEQVETDIGEGTDAVLHELRDLQQRLGRLEAAIIRRQPQG